MAPVPSVTVIGLAVLAGAWHSPRSPDDACSLLSQSEVSAALGVAVGPGQHVVPGSLKFCGWSPAGGPKIDGKKLLVSVMTARQYDMGKAPIREMTKTPVTGIGDEAYYASGGGGLGTSLSVKRGSFYVQVKAGGFPSNDALKAAEKALALEILRQG